MGFTLSALAKKTLSGNGDVQNMFPNLNLICLRQVSPYGKCKDGKTTLQRSKNLEGKHDWRELEFEFQTKESLGDASKLEPSCRGIKTGLSTSIY